MRFSSVKPKSQHPQFNLTYLNAPSPNITLAFSVDGYGMVLVGNTWHLSVNSARHTELRLGLAEGRTHTFEVTEKQFEELATGGGVGGTPTAPVG
jgi:hypothetical protein